MPLSFANPALLFGGLAAALPVIIHFLSRRKVRREKFSDLRFLSEVQARQTRRLSTRRWLLLLLRVLAILLLTCAVSGPRWGGLGGGLSGHSVLMVIDTSASMGTQQEDGTRLESAVRDAGAMLRMLPDDASVQILAAGVEVTPLLGDWLPAGVVPVEVLADLEPEDGAFDLAAVLAEAGRLARSAPGRALDIVMFSDLQKTPAASGLATAAGELSGGLPVRVLVRRTGQEVPGGGVLKVMLPRRALRPGETITCTARVLPDQADQPFTLELDGVTVAEAVATGEPGAIRDLEFSLTVPGPGLHRGWVRKAGDRLPADDARPFVLRVPERVRVLLVHGADRPADGLPGRGGWRFVQQALDPGGQGRTFAVTPLTVAGLSTGALDRADLLVLVDPDPLGRIALEGVSAWVRGGGGVLMMAGDPTRASYFGSALLPALGLPEQSPRFQSLDTGVRARLVGGGGDLLTGFGPQALRALQDVLWQRWFSLDDDDQGRALLTLPGGDPLVLLREPEAGRVLVMAADMRPEAGSLPLSAMALPLLQRLAAWAAAAGDLPGQDNVLVGEPFTVHPPRGWAPDEAAAALVSLPHDARPRPVTVDWRGARAMVRCPAATRAGFAVVTAGGDTLGQVALGTPGVESALRLQDPRAWAARLTAAGLTVAGDLTGTVAAQAGRRLRGLDLSPWFFLLTVAVLLLELWLGRGAGAPARAGSG